MAVKILSVDDETDLELLLTQYFRRKIRKGEYEFFFAHNGLEALQILLKNPDIAIILSDINMPEMDGLTLLAKVNEMRNPSLKCIMVSAYGDMDNIRHAMNNGAFDFATKPIDLDDLQITIDKDAYEQSGKDACSQPVIVEPHLGHQSHESANIEHEEHHEHIEHDHDTGRTNVITSRSQTKRQGIELTGNAEEQ